MITSHASSLFPKVATKLFWIKTNRVLAWSLIVSPFVQFAIGMSFITGLWIDLAILAAHAVLSLALFGKPETRERTWNVTMHLLGFRSRDMSERNRFLLTGYRIVLGAVAASMTFWESGLAGKVVIVLCLYPMLRLSISVFQHLYLAIGAAMRRWHKARLAEAVATAALALYAYVSFINLIK